MDARTEAPVLMRADLAVEYSTNPFGHDTGHIRPGHIGVLSHHRTSHASFNEPADKVGLANALPQP